MKKAGIRRSGSRLSIPLTAALAVVLGLLSCGDAMAKKCHACKDIAKLALKAGNAEAVAEYYLNRGKAKSYNDKEKRREVLEEARDTLLESRELARDQYEARIDFCKALGECRYDPQIDPANFCTPAEIAANPNPYYPLVPGTMYTYESDTDEGLETIVVEVTHDTREILGINCIVVRDTVWLEGVPIEDTWDWYTQDKQGNVWYFGELSIEYEDGEVAGLQGSWESGEDNAKPGIVMLADPQVGDIYRQEFLLGEAEDGAEVLAVSEHVDVPWGSFDNCIQTGDFLPTDPTAYEHKFYAPGIGFVLEVKPDTGEILELIDIENP